MVPKMTAEQTHHSPQSTPILSFQGPKLKKSLWEGIKHGSHMLYFHMKKVDWCINLKCKSLGPTLRDSDKVRVGQAQ